MRTRQWSLGLLALVCAAIFLGVSRTSACTIFYLYDGHLALGGNNEDWTDPNTFVWFVPAADGSYGRAFFGFGNGFPQGGMNNRGLFYDGAATAEYPMRSRAGRERAPADILDQMLARCATVAEAVEYLNRYDIQFMDRAMIMLGDRHGASAIYEGDDTLQGDGHAQIVTNFYQSRMSAREAGCRRKQAADDVVGQLYNDGQALSTSLMKRILDATHQEGRVSTVYSNIYDLTNGEMYIYLNHDFDTVLKLSLTHELEKGQRKIRLAELFKDVGSQDRGGRTEWNTECPKSGRPVRPDSFFEHEAKRVYFCNDECALEGASDPEQWIERVRKPASDRGG